MRDEEVGGVGGGRILGFWVRDSGFVGGLGLVDLRAREA